MYDKSKRDSLRDELTNLLSLVDIYDPGYTFVDGVSPSEFVYGPCAYLASNVLWTLLIDDLKFHLRSINVEY